MIRFKHCDPLNIVIAAMAILFALSFYLMSLGCSHKIVPVVDSILITTMQLHFESHDENGVKNYVLEKSKNGSTGWSNAVAPIKPKGKAYKYDYYIPIGSGYYRLKTVRNYNYTNSNIWYVK